MEAVSFPDFQAFWYHYLRQHRTYANRAWHFAGTTAAFLGAGVALVAHAWGWLPAGLVVAYALSWIGHYGFERNTPATFGHPLWSLGADLRMYGLTWVGRLAGELARAERGGMPD